MSKARAASSPLLRGTATRILSSGMCSHWDRVGPPRNVIPQTIRFSPCSRSTRGITLTPAARPNRQNAVTDADNNRWRTVFDVMSNTLESIDANGHITVSTLDGDDRPIAFKDPAGNISKAAFDPAGNTVQSTDPNGKLTQYQ